MVKGVPDEQVHMLYTLRDIYDGWSVAKLKDGRLINRWPVGTRKHALAQDWIDELVSMRGARTNS
jgi:hypothetical protein